MNILTDMPIAFINAVTPFESRVIVFCATTLGTITIIGVLLYLFFRKLPNHSSFASVAKLSERLYDLFILVFTVGVTYTADFLLKAHYMIPRPPVFDTTLHALIAETDYGFPSSHASLFAAIAAALFFINRRAGFAVGLLAVIIGCARILAGVHTPLDIIGGFTMGIFVAVIIDFLAESVKQKPPSLHI